MITTTSAMFYSPQELLSYRRFHYFLKDVPRCTKQEKQGKNFKTLDMNGRFSKKKKCRAESQYVKTQVVLTLCQPIGDSPECDPAKELSNLAFSLAPSNSSTESFIAVWKTAN